MEILIFSDQAAPIVLFAFCGLLAAAYGVRTARKGHVRFERVEQQGASFLLSRTVMEAGHWGSEPLARVLIGLGFTANRITLCSAFLGVVAGGFLTAGLFGLGAVIASFAALLDLLDGMVARTTKTSSAGGQVLDSALDRTVEFFFIAGAALYFRENVWTLALALLAILGSFMVSYVTALAQIQRVTVSRGLMRRPERFVILLLGAALTPVVNTLTDSSTSWPMLVSLAVVAVGSNATATVRVRELFLRLS